MSEEKKENSEQSKKPSPMEMVTEYEVECAVVTQRMNNLIDTASEALDLFERIKQGERAEALKAQLQEAYDNARQAFSEGESAERQFDSTTGKYALAFGDMYITELTHAGAYKDLFKNVKFQDWREMPESDLRKWSEIAPTSSIYPKIPHCFGPVNKKWEYFHSLEVRLSKVAVFLETGMLPEKEPSSEKPEHEKLRDSIDKRDQERELRKEVEARLVEMQDELRHHENQLEALDKDDDRFCQDRDDLLKGVVNSGVELGELTDEVGVPLLKRIGALYFSVKEQCDALVEWANSGEMDRSFDPAKVRTSNKTSSAKDDGLSRKGRISSITIENFKGIGEKVTIPLKPITLLFGANSAGKSTVLQALLYAHEVMNNRNPDADVTEFGGEKINLGGFRNLVHGHDLSKTIKIGFEYTLDDDGLPIYGTEREFEGALRPESFYDASAFKELESVRVQFSVAVDDEGSPFVKKYVVWVNREHVASIRRVSKSGSSFLYHFVPTPVLAQGRSLEADVVFQLAVNFPSQRFGEIVDVALSRITENPELRPRAKVECSEEELEVAREDIKQEMIKMMEEQGDGFLSNEGNVENEEWRIEIPDSSSVPEWGKFLNVPHFIEWQRSLENTVEPFVVTALLSAIIAGPGELIAKELDQMRYIGPIRAIPPRNYLPQKTSTSGRWADGMAGWDVLLNDIIAGKTWFEQSAYDRLNLGYEFVGCRELTIPAELLETLAEIPLKDVIPKVIEKNTVRMRDAKSKTDVEPCDVGTGVSQVIPVVAGAMSPGCRFLAVEQPELHLHPAIQCNLGDLFISQMKRYPERTFLLETHSEHLILRLLRRIRETASGKLNEKSLELTPDDVGVLYVEEVGKSVRISELRIGSDGEFIDEWPGGFFEEDFNEILGGL